MTVQIHCAGCNEIFSLTEGRVIYCLCGTWCMLKGVIRFIRNDEDATQK